ALTGGVAGWTEQQLVINLDRMVHDPGIAQTDLTRWLSDLVHYLTVTRNITLPALMECKYILARKIKDMLLSIKDRQREQVFQQTLFGPEAKVDVTFDTGFKFHDQIFWDAPKYTGGKFVFQKHFTGPDNIPKFDGKGEGGEEFECAAVIDSLSDVETWVRNVSQHVDAFRLPVALPNQKWTYPDFVVKLNDGRIMLVEYKGRDRIDTKDSYAKAAVGALWENASNGKGLYLMAEKSKTGIDVKDQILAKISTKRP
ncbi:MAG: restriction endonuclease subunit R, partial [Pseudomonadota bacterium]